ncbi:MAG TPA: hypothetical protein VI756_25665 [Blastocatellia bacterium]
MSVRVSIVFRFLAAALICSSVGAGPVRADNDQVKKELEDAYARRDKAFRDKAFDLIKSMWTADYKEKTKEGVVLDRSQVDPETAQLLRLLKDIKILLTTVDKVTEGKEKDEFVVDATSKGDFTLAGGDGNIHEVMASAKVRDIWVKTADGWKLKFHEELESTTLLDGKPV